MQIYDNYKDKKNSEKNLYINRNGRRRPEFLSVRKHAIGLIDEIINTRPSDEILGLD